MFETQNYQEKNKKNIILSNINNNISNNNNDTQKNKRIIVSKRTKVKQKGNYILENTIGEGAFAKVKLAKHIITGEKVAIKILPKLNFTTDSNPINKSSNNNISKIQKEINILRRLHHKNIIQLYEIIETKNNLYIVMEYCEGKELFDYIVKRKRLTEREACRYFQQIINGVEYLHLCNITHRDLKPENILLDNKKRIRISDFGLSHISQNFNSLLSTPCGTPLYAPPEMLRGDKYNGIYSDIWSCGIILYIMLVGDLPYADSKEKIIYQNIMTHNYYYPDTMSDDAIDLIEHMLKVNPNERYGFKEIKAHPWFNLITPKLRPGIIFNMHKIPVDEKILEKIEKMGYDKNLCIKSVQNNNYDSLMGIYLLALKQSIREGKESISDLFSEEYLNYINDYKNWIDTSKINNPLFNEYNVVNIPNNNNTSEENINSNPDIENIEVLTDSDKYLNLFDNNLDNLSNEEKKEYLNILRKRTNEVNNHNYESLNNQDNDKRNTIIKNNTINNINNQNNDKSFDSSNISYTMIREDDKKDQINNYINLTEINNKNKRKSIFKKNERNNILKQNKVLVNLKTDIKKNKKILNNNNNHLYKKINVNDIIKKRIFTKQNTQRPSPLKYNNKNKDKDKLINVNKSLISPILNEKRINNNIYDRNSNLKLNFTTNVNQENNNILKDLNKDIDNDKGKNSINNRNNELKEDILKITHNIEEAEFLDKIFNDNLIDLESDSRLILTPSGHLHDNNESKTFFSKEDNINMSISSGNNNENKTINASLRPIHNTKKLKFNDIKSLKRDNKEYAKTERPSLLTIKNIKKQKKDNVMLLTEPLDIDYKNKLKKEIEEDINKFDNDLKLIDNITKIKFVQYPDNANINENIGLFNIQDFADKLIKTTIFKNYLVRNNKQLKNEVEDKFYILEKYKNAIGLIEKLKNKIFMDKLSNFNYYTFDQYLNDEDDKIISNNLLKNKKLSLFIQKAKKTLFNDSNIIDKRSYSKNNSFLQSNNLLNQNKINLKIRSKTQRSHLNDIIKNHTQNYFYKYKKNNNNVLHTSNKGSILKPIIINKNKINSLLFRDYSPQSLTKRDKLSHSIKVRKNKKININRDYSNKSIDKSLKKRLFKTNYNLKEKLFNTARNSISKFNLDNNSNSSFVSVITEEGDNTNNHNEKTFRNKINLKKIIINNSSIKKAMTLNLNNKIFKTDNKTKRKRRISTNNKIIENNNSDQRLMKINYNYTMCVKSFRNKTIEKKIIKKNKLSLTPDHSFINKYQTKIINNNTINNNINQKILKTEKIIDKTKKIITNKKNKLKETKQNIKNKFGLKVLKNNYPIDINCILLQNFFELKKNIKKYLKKENCSVNEKDNSMRIFRNGFNIEINFYTLTDFDINNVYICFKLKGENHKNNTKFIRELLVYLHNKE